MNMYDASMIGMLKQVFPYENWTELAKIRPRSAIENDIFTSLSRVMTDTELISNFKHPGSSRCFKKTEP